MNYYRTQLDRLNLNTEYPLNIIISDSEGNKTNYMNINEESAKELINFFQSFLPRKIEFKRVNNDLNGNPRYVCHYTDLLTDKENESLPLNIIPIFKVQDNIDKRYELALKKAKQLCGKKFDNKQFNGGIVFQSYNIDNLKKSIINLNK